LYQVRFLILRKGDIVYIEEGSIVPADLRLFDAVNLNIDEALLTGESLPVNKNTDFIAEREAPVGDRTNMAFKNTLVSRGRGIGIVVSTGLNTEIGKIAKMVSSSEQQKSVEDIHMLDDPNEAHVVPRRTGMGVIWGNVVAFFNSKSNKTPLQSSMNGLMFILTPISLFLAVIVFATNSWQWDHYIVLYAVGVVIAILPEGLPAVVTVTMAVGVRKMAKQKAIVRKLAALEALGQVTNICSDKTGTLTEGKMYFIKDSD
jgi:magnesium-transporting ATPase (P-type)